MSTTAGENPKPKILCFGSVNLDEFYYVPHIVKPGETIASTRNAVKAGGKGANQSVALAMGGARVSQAAKIGRDGIWVKDLMKEKGVDINSIFVDSDLMTGRALIQLSTSEPNNAIVLFPGANQKLLPKDAEYALQDFTRGDWLLLQNEVSAGPHALELAAEKGLHIVFNPAPFEPKVVQEFDLNKVDVLIVNQIEGWGLHRETYLWNSGEPTSAVVAEKALKKYPGMKGVIVTLGDVGLIARFRTPDGGEEEITLTAEKVEVIDTTGAGDAFTGFFVASLLRSATYPQHESWIKCVRNALEEASMAAAIVVERIGAMDSIPTLEEVKARMAAKK